MLGKINLDGALYGMGPKCVIIEWRINPVSPLRSITLLDTCGNPMPDIVNTRAITTNLVDTLANMVGVRNLELIKTGDL